MTNPYKILLNLNSLFLFAFYTKFTEIIYVHHLHIRFIAPALNFNEASLNLNHIRIYICTLQ